MKGNVSSTDVDAGRGRAWLLHGVVILIADCNGRSYVYVSACADVDAGRAWLLLHRSGWDHVRWMSSWHHCSSGCVLLLEIAVESCHGVVGILRHDGVPIHRLVSSVSVGQLLLLLLLLLDRHDLLLRRLLDWHNLLRRRLLVHVRLGRLLVHEGLGRRDDDGIVVAVAVGVAECRRAHRSSDVLALLLALLLALSVRPAGSRLFWIAEVHLAAPLVQFSRGSGYSSMGRFHAGLRMRWERLVSSPRKNLEEY